MLIINVLIYYFLVEMQNSKDQQLQTLVKQVLIKLQELETSNKWQPNGDKPCAMFKMELGERIASKGVATIKYNIDKVVAFLDNPNTSKKIDQQCLEFKEIYIVKDRFMVNYQQYKAPWPVSNRDFVTVGHTFRVNGKVYIGLMSCNYPYPQAKGFVRGEIFVGGYIVEKIDENTTRITYISDSDPKGSIPSLIKNKVSQKQGEVAANIGPAMKKQGL